jgi:hypothetical protein
LQGGDFVFGNGSGGESVFGNKKTFKDERAGLILKHDRKGILSMGNSGKNSNSSQFFFTLSDMTPQCDGKHVIFGQLVSGMNVLEAAEQYGTSVGEPTVPITITDCGVYQPLMTPGSGYWYDQPDAESFSGISPTFMVRPRVVVLAPNAFVLRKFVDAMESFVSVVDQVAAEAYDDDKSALVARLEELLGDCSVDVALIAPACKSFIADLELPKSWQEKGLTVHQVALEAKPIEALDVVRSKSWLSQRIHWQLDGNS